MNLPILEHDNNFFLDSISRYIKKSSLIITDEYNYNRITQLHDKVLKVNNNSENNIISSLRDQNYENIIAIGGCTALDIGRMYASNGNLLVYPSIISTACISINRSVLANNSNENYIVKSASPQKTIINYDLIFDTSKENLRKWTFSGVLDVLSRISAIINFLYYHNKLELNLIKSFIPAIFWFMEYIHNYNKIEIDEEYINNVATLSHLTSIDVIMRDDYSLSAWSEHSLYHKMKQMFGYKESNPTHGELVGVGTLISVKIFSHLTGDKWLFDFLKRIYTKIDFQISFKYLEKIGITRSQLLNGIKEIFSKEESTLWSDYFSKNNWEIIDEIFS